MNLKYLFGEAENLHLTLNLAVSFWLKRYVSEHTTEFMALLKRAQSTAGMKDIVREFELKDQKTNEDKTTHEFSYYFLYRQINDYDKMQKLLHVLNKKINTEYGVGTFPEFDKVLVIFNASELAKMTMEVLDKEMMRTINVKS